ncbi:MAG TPA: O-antigen ligase family protein, partial [Gemmatimonadales bacterium]|nr:O-antigen ligase family protein [Gemmatimonadales bacterium]
MTTGAAPGAPPAGERNTVPWATAAALAGGVAGAAAFLSPEPGLLVLGAIALAGCALVVLDADWALYTIAAFAVLRLADIATDFHGAPSLFQPLLAVAVVGIAARWAATGERPSGAGRAAVLMAVWLLIGLASLIVASAPGDGLTEAQVLAKDMTVAVVAGMLLQRTAALRGVVWVFIGGGTLIAGISVFQFLTNGFSNNFLGFGQSAVMNIVGLTDDVRISGPIGDANFYGQLLVMIIPLAVDRMMTEQKRLLKVAAGGAAALTTAAAVFTFSRGAALALVVVAVIMLVLHPPKLWAVAAIAGVIAVTIPLLPPGYVERMTTLAQIGTVEGGTDASIRGRTSEIMAGMFMFLDHPLTGVGLGNYEDRYLEYASDLGLERRREEREPHSLYTEVAAETGIPGVVAFGAIILSAFAALRRARVRFREQGDDDTANLTRALALSLVGYLITSLFLHMAFARFAWLVLGISLAAPALAERSALP